MSNELMISVPAELMPRHEAVRQQIVHIASGMQRTFLELGRLLQEARDNDYAPRWGYARFGHWVEEASGLDMSERNAYYLINVAERTEALGLPDEELLQVKFSKLKEICALPPDKSPPEVLVEMIDKAKTDSLEKVREAIAKVREISYVNRTFKFTQEDVDDFVDPAIERARRIYGDSVGFDGSPADIAPGRAIALICADSLQGTDDEDTEIDDAEYQDAFGTEETFSDQVA